MLSINKKLLFIFFSLSISSPGILAMEETLQDVDDGSGLDDGPRIVATTAPVTITTSTTTPSIITTAPAAPQIIAMTPDQFNSLLQTINPTNSSQVLKVEIKNKPESFWKKTWEKGKNFFKKLLFLGRATGVVFLVYSGSNLAAYYNLIKHPEYIKHALMGIKGATVIFVSAEFFETVKDLLTERQRSIWTFIRNSTVIVIGSVVANGMIYKLVS